MRKTLLIITALMLIVGCSESDAQRSRNIIVSDVIEYHDNEGIPKKIRVYDISRDKVALTYKEIKFYRNGQKSAEGTYKDGKADGLYTNWYENGQKKEEVTYKDGQAYGLFTSWYENGQKASEKTHKGIEKEYLGKTRNKHYRERRNNIILQKSNFVIGIERYQSSRKRAYGVTMQFLTEGKLQKRIDANRLYSHK